MTGKRKSQDATQKSVEVQGQPGETEADAMARVMTGPYLRHGIANQSFIGKMTGTLPGDPKFADFGKAMKVEAELASKGDLTLASRMLTTQALTLDSMFTELARRAAINMSDYPLATERYAKLALKAQANCRANLEALARLHQPREQTVRHVHVNEGGQAVIADQFHHHGGSAENAKTAKQSHAPGRTDQGAAMLGKDAGGPSLPIASGEGQETLPNARRD